MTKFNVSFYDKRGKVDRNITVTAANSADAAQLTYKGFSKKIKIKSVKEVKELV